MKRLFSILTFLSLLIPTGFSRNNVEELIMEGIRYHNNKQYDEAIVKYKEALKIDPASSLANYEMAYSYFAKRDYKKAVEYSQTVIKLNSGHEHESYVIAGSSLNMLGKPADAIKIYREGLTKFPQSHLLYYNLALVYTQQKQYTEAEQAAIKGVEIKPNHANSHLLLSSVMANQDQRIKAVLAMYYFLMLEPDTQRSVKVYTDMIGQLSKGVNGGEGGFNIALNPAAKDDPLTSVELSMSLSVANWYNEENKNKNAVELLIQTNKLIFSTLGIIKEGQKGFWWDFYVDKLYNMYAAGNLDAFTYYISQMPYRKIVRDWMLAHRAETENFLDWFNKNIVQPKR